MRVSVWFSLVSVIGFAGMAVGAFPSFEALQRDGIHAFTYEGKPFTYGEPVSEKVIADTDRKTVRQRVYRTPDGKLELRDTWTFYKRFPAVEVLPELVCVGDQETGIVADFQAFRLTSAPTPRVRIRTLTGTVCNERDFMPIDHTLAMAPDGKREVILDVAEARSSSAFMPYYGIDFSATEGIEIGLGWTGAWTARFRLTDQGLTAQAGMRRTHFRLLPGETIRQPSVLLFLRQGISIRDGKTAFHRFVIDEKSPRDSKGRLIDPILPITAGGGNKSDEAMLDIIDWGVKNRLPFDAFWVDAAWYGPPHNPDPYSNCGDKWWGYTGYWTFNPNVHPDGNLLRVFETAHRHGMKALLWVEPERSMSDMPFAKDHPEWMLPKGWQENKAVRPLLVNLGDPACCDFVIEMISNLIRQNKLDIYRQDFNLDPGGFWRENDKPDRIGISEAKHIAGLYRFWDTLRQRFPDLLIENCSSGGRRLDFEMVSRSHSYCRTDFAIGHRGSLDQVLNVQNITLNTLCYQPFQGSETTPAATFDNYGFFSAVCAGSVFTPSDWNGGIVRREFTPEETLWFKKVFTAANRMRRHFTGDFYPQTDPTTLALDQWCAYQMHRPDLKSGFAIALRRPECKDSNPDAPFTFHLKGIDPDATYTVERFEGETVTMKGSALATLAPSLKAEDHNLILLFYAEAGRPAAPEKRRTVYDPAAALKTAFGRAEINPCRDTNGVVWSVLRREKPEGRGGIYGTSRFAASGGGIYGIETMGNSYVAANAGETAPLFLGITANWKNRIAPGELIFHPEPTDTPGGGRTVLRFTVPEAGRYSFDLRFRPLNRGAGKIDASVVLDGEILYQAELVRDGGPAFASGQPSFSFADKPLKAGQQLECVVGAGLTETSNACDGTAVTFSLSKE